MVSVTSVPRGDTDTRKRMRLAINFLNFTFSALLKPVFGASSPHIRWRPAGAGPLPGGFLPLLFGVAAAIVLSFLLKETGPGVQHSLAKS
jgi:hypothetical protein